MNKNMIDIALEIAKKAHKNQHDKAGEPYINHPIFISEHVDTRDEKIVALLHDVVEDSSFTLDELRAYGFSDDIIDAVNAITKRNGEDYESYINRVKNNPIAVNVKKADLTHNMDISRIPNPTERDYNRLKKYKKIITELNNV